MRIQQRSSGAPDKPRHVGPEEKEAREEDAETTGTSVTRQVSPTHLGSGRGSGSIMVGERRHGPRRVQLGPRLQAFPEELLRQRRGHAGQPEYLIRWCLVAIHDGGSAAESEPENVLMWMSGEDAYANCPGLLGGREQEARRGEEPPAGAALDEEELSDMKRDVEKLVRRARAQMAKSGDFSLGVAHTVSVLSAYAAIGPLVGVFKEAGALRLLMELLGNKDTHTRRGAAKMLRALASHDAGNAAL
ncbi:Cullin-9 [Liparis tanakae]|uniref:Cullin-9 n=1 Tax=Liparis tanakae TaxID=230148 RepID=A0A4Z2EXW2_9TELE|nr:Cullin-9 [Liparis tanakae]